MVSENILRIEDLGNGHIQISWQKGNETRTCPQTFPFRDPLSLEERCELRWYLEKYLNFPYGAEESKAKTVEERMPQWGQALFDQVFPKLDTDPDPHALYHEAVREGLDSCEICIASDNPEFLNIPWELIYDPTPGRGYLAQLLGGFYRQRSRQKIIRFPRRPANEPFRILLVIARPYEQDVSISSIARPMLFALRDLRGQIQIDVLRPPTFDALVDRLGEQRGYYSLVHFDGHGIFAPSTGNHAMQFGGDGQEGHLVFEKEDGSLRLVTSSELCQTLATCKVPLFILNACQSAEEGTRNPFSSVASSLVATGAKGVVAMSYSVYVSAAAKFMERLYRRLASHFSLSEAVTDARKRLFTEPEHESVIGPINLRDWMVPTLYQRESGYVPIPKDTARAAEKEEVVKEKALLEQAAEACPEGRWGFIGRDYEIREIERALRNDDRPWVLLAGLGGAGKSELAFGFVRWFAETGGCRGGAFSTDFKAKADFGQVIGSIVGYATEFSRLSDEEQWKAIVTYLRENPCLLVWDNFETVNGYPEDTEPLAPKEEREKLKRFLKALKGGKSRVIITTRKQTEDWLKVAYNFVPISGLNDWDATRLAQVILGTIGKKLEDYGDDPDFLELVKILKGHPRSLEIVLPQLRTKTPAVIIAALEGTEISLDNSYEYVLAQLSERSRKHLPFIGLFTSYVHIHILSLFASADREPQKSYAEIFGEVPDARGWEAVLEDAANNGLISPLGNMMYELHPTLTQFLHTQLALSLGSQNATRLESEFSLFYAGWAHAYFDKVKKGDRNAMFAVGFEEGNLRRALRIALKDERWDSAQAITQTLNEFYEISGRTAEWRALRSQLLGVTGRNAPTDKDKADLWMYLLGSEANDALERNQLPVAEASHRKILDYLVSLKDPAVEPNIAVAHHQLGMIAQERQQFDKAEQWYKKALEIRERLGLERDAAGDYHHLGIIAQERQQFDKAEQWYKKALEIYERLGLERDAADEYHQLGNITLERQQFDEAEQWYKKALEIRERLGLERDAADEYHQLGIIAQKRQQFDEAEQWYKKALEIRERLGLERDAADEYHQLGIIAQKRQQFDEAEQWYKKALVIKERLNHPPLMVDTLAQMGVLFDETNRIKEAIASLASALDIAVGYKMRVGYTILANLALIMKKEGEEKFTRIWREVLEGTEPPLEALRKMLKKLEESGEE